MIGRARQAQGQLADSAPKRYVFADRDGHWYRGLHRDAVRDGFG